MVSSTMGHEYVHKLTRICPKAAKEGSDPKCRSTFKIDVIFVLNSAKNSAPLGFREF